jgi:phosphoribosylamine---glycine ligase
LIHIQLIMNILLLGSGGRENALAWKIKKARGSNKLFIAPGNAGTASYGTNVNIQVNDFQSIKDFSLSNKIKMVIVGPEDPLVRGIWDFFKNDAALAHIPVIGPSAYGAQLEGSKAFAKKFMARHAIPTAKYREITSHTEGVEFLKTLTPPYVLKADGLAAGKGVLILDDLGEASNELKTMLDGKFGTASQTVVIEEFLSGIEFSVFVLTDGKTYKILPVAKDYKRIGEGDTGLNTGGMGAVSPVPFVDKKMMRKVEERVIKPTIAGIAAENIDYMGIVFIGLISVGGEPYVIEYNCRLGDPETEVIIPRLNNDILDVLKRLVSGKLETVKIQQTRNFAATIVLTAGGYPEDYRKGDAITIDFQPMNEAASLVFHGGTQNTEGVLRTNGGRVLALTSFGETLEKAVGLSAKRAGDIHFEGRYFRRDIGLDLLKK